MSFCASFVPRPSLCRLWRWWVCDLHGPGSGFTEIIFLVQKQWHDIRAMLRHCGTSRMDLPWRLACNRKSFLTKAWHEDEGETAIMKSWIDSLQLCFCLGSLFGPTRVPMQLATAMGRSPSSRSSVFDFLGCKKHGWFAKLADFGRTSRRAFPSNLNLMSRRFSEAGLEPLKWDQIGPGFPCVSGRLLGIRGGDFICFYDWTEHRTQMLSSDSLQNSGVSPSKVH